MTKHSLKEWLSLHASAIDLLHSRLGAAFFLGTWKEQSKLMSEWRKSMSDEEKAAAKKSYDRGVEILKSIKGDYYE